MSISLSMMQMSESQVDAYSTNIDAWVNDEEDSNMTKTIRVIASELMQELVIKFKEDAVTAFTNTLGARLQEVASQSNNEFSWKGRESCIFAVGSLSNELAKYPALWNGESFISQILLPDITEANVHPITRGRALWCASMVSHSFKLEDLGPVLNRISETLNTQEVLGTKVYAIRALSKLILLVQNDSVIGNYISGLMEGLISVLDQVKGDTLFIVLKTLVTLIKLSPEVACCSVEAVIARLLILWAHNYNDSALVEQLISLVTAFSHHQSCQHLLQSCLAGPLLSIIQKNATNKTYVNETALRIAKTMLAYSSWPLHESLMKEFFPEILKIMLTSTSPGTIAFGTDTLRAFASLMKDNLLEYKNEQGENGLAIYINIIARLLSNIPDSASSKVGLLIEKILVIFQFKLDGILDELLSAVLNKLHTTQDLELQSGLLFVIIRLFYVNQDLAIDFLLSKSLDNSPALNVFLRLWTDLHESIKGKYRQSFSLIGMCNLFLSSNNKLDGITVKGDAIATNTGRSTRSKPQKTQYAEEGLKFRIIKLLIREHMVIEEGELDDYNSEDYTDDDDDDDDDGEEGHEEEENIISQFLIDNNMIKPGTNFVNAEKMAYFNQIADDKAGFEDEEDDDPQIKEDPLYQVNLKDYILDFYKAFAAQNPSAFEELYNSLPPMDKNHLKKMMNIV
jgi:hypothetical protein